MFDASFYNSKKRKIYNLVLFMNIWSRVTSSLVCSGDVSSSTNVALNKPASQSSTFISTGPGQPSGYANQANDGNGNPDFNAGSCSHTLKDVDPIAWWLVDLGATHMITSVSITNRDRFTDRLRNLHIDLADTNVIGATGLLEGSRLCYYFTANNVGAGERRTFTCEAFAYGRYFRISIYPNDWKKPLAMCEVEVVGYPVTCSIVEDILSTSPFQPESTSIINTNTDSDVTPISAMSLYETSASESPSTSFSSLSPSSPSSSSSSPSSLSPSSSSPSSSSTSSLSPSSPSSSPSSPSSSPPSSSPLWSTATSSSATCACNCGYLHNFGNTTLEEQIEKIKKELTIDKRETNSFKRKLTSAEDNRISSKSIGFVGVAVLSLVFGGIVILDLPVLHESVKELMHCIKNIRNRGV